MRAMSPLVELPLEPRVGEVLVWTDGACRRNPGPGGWAAIVVPADGQAPQELSGSAPATTNNRMELTAALEGLRSLAPGSREGHSGAQGWRVHALLLSRGSSGTSQWPPGCCHVSP